MKNEKFNLVCVAHPDDETIFFGGLLQRKRRGLPWVVVCATDGNADGQGALRRKQFEKACRTLGVSDTRWWGFADRFEKRLPTEELIAKLRELPVPAEVFTHSIIGDYGHPHHQDVCYSVHEALEGHRNLYALAYNAFPEFTVALSEKQFETKARVLTEIYGSETNRFLNLLPATHTEGYLRYDPREVRAIYSFFAAGKTLNVRALDRHKWLAKYLREHGRIKRPF